MWKRAVKKFCLNTALHGYKFIFLPKRILLERIIWTVICVISLLMAISVLLIAWFDFRRSPTILVTDSNHYPIWNYDFPAVTVCDFNKISKRKAFQLARNLSNSKEDQVIVNLAWDFRLLMHLIKPSITLAPRRNYTRLQNFLDERGITVDEVLEKLAPDCEGQLKKCLWKREERRCEHLFEMIKTTDGFCCSFNYFATKNYSFRGAFANKAPTKPRRVSACGYQTGVEVMVKNEPDDYFANFIPSIGYSIRIHNPYNFPDWNVQVLLQGQKLVNLISIDPTVYYCSNDIKKMNVEDRQCLFPHERQLIYFDMYTYHNCMSECRMNLTWKLCNCVPFYYVDKRVHWIHLKICNLYDVRCLRENNDLIVSSVPGFNFSAVGSDHVYGEERGYCNCLPDCESTEYVAESSSGVLCEEFMSSQLDSYDPANPKYNSIFRVYFNDLVGIRNRMDVKFDWHTLLGYNVVMCPMMSFWIESLAAWWWQSPVLPPASVCSSCSNFFEEQFFILREAYYGGLLGLFVGFSFVSVVEIIYFLAERFIEAIKYRSKKKNTVGISTMKLSKINPMIYGKLDAKKLNIVSDTQARHIRKWNSGYYH